MSEPMTLEQASHNLRMYANTDCDADGVPIVLACADAIDAATAERDRLRHRIDDMTAAMNAMSKTTMGTLDKVKAERDALRARIESAPCITATRNGVVRTPVGMFESGKRMRLVVEDE